MAPYTPLPGYDTGGSINFDPVNTGIKSVGNALAQRRMEDNNRNTTNALSRLDYAAAQASTSDPALALGIGNAQLQKGRDDRANRSADQDYQHKAAQHLAGIAQMTLQAAPEQRATMMQKLYASQPDIAQHLTKYGVDPNDHEGAAKFMIAEARGYINPNEEALSKAQLAHMQGQNALLPLQKQQLEQGIAQGAQKQQLLKDFLSDGSGNAAPAQPQQPGQTAPPGRQSQIMDPRRIMALEAAGVLPAGAGKVMTEDPQYQQAQRMKAAQSQGLDLKDPATQQYVLTGSYPKIEKNYPAIQKADDKLGEIDNSIDTAKDAVRLNKEAYSGWAPETRAWLGGMIGLTSAQKTQEYQAASKLMSQEIAKGNSIGRVNQFEQRLMADLQGGLNQTVEARGAILDRALKHIQSRREVVARQSDELRTGNYYKPKTDAQPQGPIDMGGGFKIEKVQ
jgi:hypothetical protein